MSFPRSAIIDVATTPYYHVMTKCVRGSFLCGINPDTLKDFTHRKQWIVDRLKSLSRSFAIQVCAYAVLSNHYHLVLFVDEETGKSLNDQEVFERWQNVFPTDAKRFEKLDKIQQAEKIRSWRERLIDISWLMRCLNEHIAKRANGEDECLGRFWAGRFKSQALMDDGAIFMSMAYVDLNPLRANIAQTPEDSDFTSIQERILFAHKQIDGNVKFDKPSDLEKYDNLQQPNTLMPFFIPKSKSTRETLPLTFSDYLKFVDYTARLARDDKASMPDDMPSILERLELRAGKCWKAVSRLGSSFSYMVGNLAKHPFFGKDKHKCPLKGAELARECYLE